MGRALAVAARVQGVVARVPGVVDRVPLVVLRAHPVDRAATRLPGAIVAIVVTIRRVGATRPAEADVRGRAAAPVPAPPLARTGVPATHGADLLAGQCVMRAADAPRVRARADSGDVLRRVGVRTAAGAAGVRGMTIVVAPAGPDAKEVRGVRRRDAHVRASAQVLTGRTGAGPLAFVGTVRRATNDQRCSARVVPGRQSRAYRTR